MMECCISENQLCCHHDWISNTELQVKDTSYRRIYSIISFIESSSKKNKVAYCLETRANYKGENRND